MKIARQATQLAALAAVGAMALAACGSGGGGGSSNITPSGAFGAVPAQSGTAHAGTLSIAEPPGATPTWIFPITPGANSSVYTAYSFQYQMWRPLSWFPNGSQVKENKPLSLANDPVWSNGNKTVSIT